MLLAVALAACVLLAQHEHPSQPFPPPDPELRQPLLLLRQNKTEEARKELNALLAKSPGSAELYFQLARSYLSDFYSAVDPARRRNALSLAMEALENTLRRNAEHIPALKAKAILHARAELLFYNPNLAYQYAARIARLQPSASEYLLSLTDWLSGEVRFTAESGHRVPHDPLLGLDRSIELLDRVIDSAVPFSNEEAVALSQMARTLAKRGDFPASIEYFQLALARPSNEPIRQELLREVAVSFFRQGNFAEASRGFYRALEAGFNSIDQWLLHVTLNRWEGAAVKLPGPMIFPAATPNIDAKNRPLLAFTNIASQLGVDRRDGNGTCAFGDLDNDGRQDLVLAGSGTFLGVYRNEGQRFREITVEAGLAGVPSGYSLNLIDYDNDGKLDLYLALNGWNGPMANRLYRNLGSGRFEDVSAKSGAADPGSGFVSVWGDLDQDGYLDLIVANGVLKDGSVPQIYRNRGGGSFVNVTKQAGIHEPPTHGAIGVALGDYDRDGDLDIFFNGLENSPNRLYRNDGKFHFTDVTRQAGIMQPPHNGFVAFFTDYNNDALPDLLVTSLAPWDAVIEGLKRTFFVKGPEAIHRDSVRLFRNQGNGTFTDATFESKLYYPMGVMGAGVADWDNDGFTDFYFGTGDPQLSRLEPNRFFHNAGNGAFQDLTSVVGVAKPGNKGHGVCFIDWDNDGDLDVYTQLGGHYPGDHAENAFYSNEKANGNHWLQIELEGVKSNRFAVGTSIIVKAGSLTVHREVKGSEGFGATNPYRQHFGLGRNAFADSIEITWPGGSKQILGKTPANRLYFLREGDTALKPAR